MKAHDDLTFTEIGATMAYYDLTFNVIGATIESPSQNPPACLYKPRACSNNAEVLRQNPCGIWLSLARRGAGLADSRLTSPRDPSALLREVPLPLSFCGVPPTEKGNTQLRLLQVSTMGEGQYSASDSSRHPLWEKALLDCNPL